MTYGDLLGSATECGIYTFTNKPKHLKQYKQNRENIVGFKWKRESVQIVLKVVEVSEMFLGIFEPCLNSLKYDTPC